MLPPSVARTLCPLGSVTRNVALGNTSVTVPSSCIASSFVIRPGKGSGSNLRDVFRRRSLLPLDHVELDAVAFRERLEAVALDCGVVNEAVLAATVRGDEAEPL